MINFIILTALALALPLSASPDKAMKECQKFNNKCDVITCWMSPLASGVIDTFENNFTKLEQKVLAGIQSDLPANRQRILNELKELKFQRDLAKSSTLKNLFSAMKNFFTGGDQITKLEKELFDLESLIAAKPNFERAIDEITIVRDRLRHLRANLVPRALLTVPGGSFKMGENNDIAVTLRPFMVAQTHVTRGEWEQLAKYDNPVYDSDNSLPVVNISWASMVMYTVKLNERLGLSQPLDMSQMDSSKFTGRWEDGTLSFKDEGSKLRVDLKKNGYRLPTEAEWEYLARNLGSTNGKYPDTLSEYQLVEYSVYNENSGGHTADVKSKKPLLIDGREIYDLMGNVWIGTLDAYEETAPLGGDNPVRLSESFIRVIRGGSWNSNARALRSAYRQYVYAGNRYDDVGLRLVRTLP